MPPSMYEGLLVSMPQAPGDHNYKTVPTVVTTQPSAGAAAQVEAACFTEVDDAAVVHQSSCEYDGKDMTAIIKLLEFLEGRLNSVSTRCSSPLLGLMEAMFYHSDCYGSCEMRSGEANNEGSAGTNNTKMVQKNGYYNSLYGL